jgi:hypothetical protein
MKSMTYGLRFCSTYEIILVLIELREREKIMKYANHHAYSDVNPYEVVRVVSDKCLEIREMDAEIDQSVDLEFIPGGFSAHCANQRDQKWFIKSNEEFLPIRIRFSKAKSGWYDKHGRFFILSNAPRKFYDFNF